MQNMTNTPLPSLPSSHPLHHLAYNSLDQTTITVSIVLDVLDMPSACQMVEQLCWVVLVRDTCARLGAGRPLRVAPVLPGGFSNCRGTCA